MTFPEYQGVIPREHFIEICLICGNPEPRTGVVIRGRHAFSLCQTHHQALELLKNDVTTHDLLMMPLRRLV